MSGTERQGVLFVCMGNICRSPLAEGVFLHVARERGVADRFEVDSAGTGHWHIGKRADPRSIEVALRRGVDLPSRARQIDPPKDWARFDHIIVMDESNRSDVIDAGAPAGRVVLLRAFDPLCEGLADAEREVPDPYYGGDEGFDAVYDMVERACRGLLDQLTAE
jgi:protein-tyrosine phosphatase